MGHKLRSIVFLLMVMACSFLLPVCPVFGHEEVIRIGFPIQEGLTMVDENGNYSGYTYDYLKEVAQYTGWRYEFVQVDGTLNEQLTKLLEMLSQGEIDLLGAMSYSEQMAEIYDFPGENYGNAYSVIAVKDKEDRIDEYNLSDYKGLRVALLKRAEKNNQKFFQYAKLNGIDYEVVWCNEEEDRLQKVMNNEADALIDIDLSLEENFRSVAKYSPTPFYFAVTKGNSRIVNELNQAINYITDINPMLQTNLYNKYFARSGGQLILNSQEKAYIQENPRIKVLVRDGFGPLQYYDDKGLIKGVAADLLNDIAQHVGWEVEYVYTDKYSQYEDALVNKEADLVLTIQYDYDSSLRKDLLLSNPYLETEPVLVAYEEISATDLTGRKKAVFKGDRKDVEPQEAVYYDSVEEALQAVEKGECDYTYTNSYTASFYQRKNQQKHTVIYPQAGNDSVKYSIGILHKDAKLLSAILNKGINSIDTTELESFIYNNAQQDQEITLVTVIRANPFLFSGIILFIAVCVLGILYRSYRKQIKMKKQIELENTRYRYLSDIMKEVTFTYSYEEDLLILSQEGIKLFHTDEQIPHYSAYPSNVAMDENAPGLYKLVMQKKDIDKEVLLKAPSAAQAEWYRVIIKVVLDGEKAVSAIGRIQNIHQEKLERENLVHKSMLDGLTNIYNSGAMKKEIGKLLEKKETAYALFILDLDDFKDINDRYGHYTGDQVLIHTAQALEKIFAENAVVGRLGGDEFVVLVNYAGREALENQCREFFRCLDACREKTGCPIPSVSIGIALSKEEDDFISLYQRADKILYAVKDKGKNNFQIGS